MSTEQYSQLKEVFSLHNAEIIIPLPPTFNSITERWAELRLHNEETERNSVSSS